MYREAPAPSPLVVLVSGRVAVGIDRRTGRRVWVHGLAENNERMSLASRVCVTDDRVLLVSSSDMKGGWSADVYGIVQCLDYLTGRLLWEQRFDPKTNAAWFNATLLVEGGQLLVAAGRDLFAFALDSGAPQWLHHLEDGVNLSAEAALAVPGTAVQADRDRS